MCIVSEKAAADGRRGKGDHPDQISALVDRRECRCLRDRRYQGYALRPHPVAAMRVDKNYFHVMTFGITVSICLRTVIHLFLQLFMQAFDNRLHFSYHFSRLRRLFVFKVLLEVGNGFLDPVLVHTDATQGQVGHRV